MGFYKLSIFMVDIYNSSDTWKIHGKDLSAWLLLFGIPSTYKEEGASSMRIGYQDCFPSPRRGERNHGKPKAYQALCACMLVVVFKKKYQTRKLTGSFEDRIPYARFFSKGHYPQKNP